MNHLPGEVIHVNNVKVGRHPMYCDRQFHYDKSRDGGRINRWLSYSHEDKPIPVPDTDWQPPGSVTQYLTFIILRDPFNWLASRIRAGQTDQFAQLSTAAAQRAIALWTAYAETAVAIENDEPAVADLWINYNRWSQDRAYRQSLIERIGVPFTDAGRDTVLHWGGGSSFEGRSKDGRASEMKTNERWQHFQDDDSYWQLLDDPRLLALASQLWPEHTAWPPVKEKLGWQP